MEFFLNVFIEFSEFEPTTSCVRNQDATTAPLAVTFLLLLNPLNKIMPFLPTLYKL